MSEVTWAEFKFPPINLWNMQLHSEIVQLINRYYYEHYKHLWEEGEKEAQALEDFMLEDWQT